MAERRWELGLTGNDSMEKGIGRENEGANKGERMRERESELGFEIV